MVYVFKIFDVLSYTIHYCSTTHFLFLLLFLRWLFCWIGSCSSFLFNSLFCSLAGSCFHFSSCLCSEGSSVGSGSFSSFGAGLQPINNPTVNMLVINIESIFIIQLKHLLKLISLVLFPIHNSIYPIFMTFL